MIDTMKTWWNRLEGLPMGRKIFSGIVGFLIPYTGTISPQIVELAPGRARVYMSERRGIKNHLNSVHALAIANLGEFTTGLALHFAMRPDQRAILINLSAEYIKKARGKVFADARVELPPAEHDIRVNAHAELTNENGDAVARIMAIWLVSKKVNNIAKI